MNSFDYNSALCWSRNEDCEAEFLVDFKQGVDIDVIDFFDWLDDHEQ